MIPVLVCVLGIGLSPSLSGIARPHVLTDREESRLASAVEDTGAEDWNDPDLRGARSQVCQSVFGQRAELSWVETRHETPKGGAL